MFFAGLDLDRGLLTETRRIALSVALLSTAVPFAAGFALATRLPSSYAGTSHNRLGFELFLAAAMSVTAFPVLARILAERGLLKTTIGGLAMQCAAVADVAAWTGGTRERWRS